MLLLAKGRSLARSPRDNRLSRSRSQHLSRIPLDSQLGTRNLLECPLESMTKSPLINLMMSSIFRSMLVSVICFLLPDLTMSSIFRLMLIRFPILPIRILPCLVHTISSGQPTYLERSLSENICVFSIPLILCAKVVLLVRAQTSTSIYLMKIETSGGSAFESGCAGYVIPHKRNLNRRLVLID
jgi:hypothetical protein